MRRDKGSPQKFNTVKFKVLMTYLYNFYFTLLFEAKFH